MAANGERAVAFARDCLEHLPITDAQISAPVGDRSRGLHRPRYDRNAGATNAEVLCDPLLSDLNYVVLYAIGKKQQPNRKSLLYDVENAFVQPWLMGYHPSRVAAHWQYMDIAPSKTP